MKLRAFLTTLIVACTALFVSATPALAAQPSPEETGRVVKLPESAADHLALAKSYDEKAATWRKEAAYHREMAVAYKKWHPDYKGVRHPAAVEMEKHCGKIASDAEKLAADAEATANYHRLLAKEPPQ